MRILTVGNMYPPHHYGGYELVWAGAVEHLRSRGHEVRVLTTDLRTDSQEPDGPDVYRQLRWHLRDGEFEKLGASARLSMARHNHRVLDRHLDDLRPDVVSWWSMGGLSLTMLETVRRRKLPAVAFVIDDWLDYGRQVDPWLRIFRNPRREPFAPLAEKLARIPTKVELETASSYVFVSDYTRQHALGVGLDLMNTDIAHCGIHEDYLEAAPEQPWSWRLLYVGRLDPRKGVDVAVQSLSHLPTEARLDIAGGWDRNEEARLRELAAQEGVGDRVHFSGQLGRRELIAAYGAADAVVFPVRWSEPWGLVPLEAMARGRPVVATGRGGSGEYLRDQENCLLVEADDPAGLAAALSRLASDPDLRTRLREGGLATAPLHTEQVFNDAVEQAVAEAAGAVRSAVPAAAAG